MIIKRICGATRTLGKSQGYLGLPLRDEVINCAVGGPGTPRMLTAWEPTPEELERLNRGGLVYLSIHGNVHPPVMLTVEEPEA